MATAELGSTERTNQLLQEASKQTGIAAQSFTIPTTSLTPATPLQFAPPTTDTTNYNGITGGISDSIINEYKTLNQQLTDKQNAQEKAGTDITKLMEVLTNKTADTQVANETAGVNKETENLNKYVQQLADLNAQASSLNREAQAIPLITQERNANTGATDAGIAPQNASALRLNAIKALSIGQQSDIAAAAATGSNLRLQAAKDKAQQIIDLKYKPLEDALAIKEKQYELNKDVLMSIDKRRTEALGLAIDKEKTALADKKAKDNTIQNMIIEASPIAPQNILDNAKQIAKNGGTPSEVAIALGKYGGDYYKTELLKQQIETEKAQRAKIYADTEKTKTETNLLGTTGGAKPPTETQQVTAGYATRTQQANTIINNLESKVLKFDPVTYRVQTDVHYPNSLKSSAIQTIEQAERNFLNAVLRKESGAAIGKDEFDSGVKQYFPVPGDNLQTIANKRQNRQTAINSLIAASGSAYGQQSSNLFSEALGQGQTIPGTNIINSVLPDGSLNFNIPK